MSKLIYKNLVGLMLFSLVACNSNIGAKGSKSHNPEPPNPGPNPDTQHKLNFKTNWPYDQNQGKSSLHILRHKIIDLELTTQDIQSTTGDIVLSVTPDNTHVLSVIDSNSCKINKDQPSCIIQLFAKDVGSTYFTVSASGFDPVKSEIINVAKIEDLVIDSSSYSACVLDSYGYAYCWGLNQYKQLGKFTDAIDVLAPVPLVTDIRFSKITLSSRHSCGLDLEGQAYCWGSNYNGELGIGDKAVLYKDIPTKVFSDVFFKDIASGYHYSCGLDKEGKVYCWGNNESGQLGNDNIKDIQWIPKPVQTNLRFTTISTGGNHVCGIASDTYLYCWGSNQHGELGVGYQNEYEIYPVKVDTDIKFSKISMGNSYSCGIDNHSKAYCWGNNINRALGNDEKGGWEELNPVQVLTDKLFQSLVAGNDHTCGITLSNEIYCWGNNDLGQIGNDELHVTAPRPVPTTISGAFMQISSGVSFACVRYDNDEISCWGSNLMGELGDGRGGIFFGDEPFSPLPVTVVL